VIEPFIRELHRAFPGAEIVTTFQMSDEFCSRENISSLPMEMYYGFHDQEDLHTALAELSSAGLYASTGHIPFSSPYIEEVLKSNIVIDFSGDMWGDNADFLGRNRFLIGLIKVRIAQLLHRPTAMLAVSAGPFRQQRMISFARDVFEHFDLVTIREPLSLDVLKDHGFNTSNVSSLACPSFLFEPFHGPQTKELMYELGLHEKGRGLVGFILCGWNFQTGPFDKWPRPDDDYSQFAEAIEFMTEELGLRVYLMSHANGFQVPPAQFKLIHGRDYPIMKQLDDVLRKRGVAKNYQTLDGIYDPWQTKAIIGHFDMLVSGRIHGAVAALSQHVPTVIIDYGHEPKAHKLRGFAMNTGTENYVADPIHAKDVIDKIRACWESRHAIRMQLEKRIPEVRNLAQQNFQIIRDLYDHKLKQDRSS